jgi:DNA-binding MarR family transcriptional regulator/GNAT superfamily N-acetyltransferase
MTMNLLSQSSPSDARIARVREFNRFYTTVIGALREGLLDTPYSLTEARVLFELAQRDTTEVAGLREVLGLDAGHLSRTLARLEDNGLLTRDQLAADRRRQVAKLTRKGRQAFSLLDERATEEVRALLEPVRDEDQRRLVAAMTTVRDILDPQPGAASWVLRSPRSGDYGWVVARHGAVYAQEFGWDESFEALVARIVADYIDHRDPRREAAWIAEVDGEPAGCVFCVRHDDTTAQLRLLLVEPRARGLGIGTRLVEECLRFAKRAGYRQMRLWTNDVLVAARRIYEGAGFELVEQQPHHSFGHDLVGQTWACDL